MEFFPLFETFLEVHFVCEYCSLFTQLHNLQFVSIFLFILFYLQVIIQGFRSYRDQTVVEPFSSKHNVIGKCSKLLSLSFFVVVLVITFFPFFFLNLFFYHTISVPSLS